MSEVVAVVHAKGDSDRVPSKNMRRLGDRPLFCHVIGAAIASRLVDRVVVDSDSEEILLCGQEYGAEPLRRPASLASNRATGDDLAAWQASSFPQSAVIVQTVPTSPFLSPESIDRAVECVQERGVDSAVGVFSEPVYLWRAGRPAYFLDDGSIPNSSDMEPIVYETTGLYAVRTAYAIEFGKRMNPESCLPVHLSRLEAVDINTEEDLAYAEIVWRGLQGK